MTQNKQKKPLVLIGDSLFAEIAYEYFNDNSPYEVRGFSVESKFLKRKSLNGLPVVPFEEIEKHFPPSQFSAYAALVYTQLNRLRTRFVTELKKKKYSLASYISPNAFVWKNAKIGEHCFIFENNVIQPFVEIGSNVVLWSGNHIGHHATIGDHTFVSSHCVISGSVRLGKSCFVGVNAALANDIAIGDDCLIGAGALVTKDVPANTTVKGVKSDVIADSARSFFKVKA